jgi:hypothetical protein
MGMQILAVHLIRLYHQLLIKYPIFRLNFSLMNQEHAKNIIMNFWHFNYAGTPEAQHDTAHKVGMSVTLARTFNCQCRVGISHTLAPAFNMKFRLHNH